MFEESFAIYEAVYAFKDYQDESERLNVKVRQHKQSDGNKLLDVACGTGGHIAHFRGEYEVEGLDLNPGMLAVARSHHPEVTFHQADMVDFNLETRFDVVVCLFSSIGYLKTLDRLGQAVECMSRHLQPGGVLVIEPWFSPSTYHPGNPHALYIDEPDLKIARMVISEEIDGLAVLDFHYLVADDDGIRYFTERHELGLFTHEQYIQALEASGLQVTHDPEGLMGRGMYIGVLAKD